MPNVLSEVQVAQYRYDGYAFPFAALSESEIVECRAGLARFEEWLGMPVPAADRRWRSAPYVFMPWADALVRHPRILDVVEDVIGPDILVYTATFFIKEANSPTFAAWHQDATYFGLDPHEHVTAWVALTDAGAKAGCMEVVSSRGAPAQLRHGARRVLRPCGDKAHTALATWRELNDLVVARLPHTSVARQPALGEGVETFDQVRRNRDLALPSMNPLERPSVPSQLFLGAVAGFRFADDQRPEPIRCNRDAFYTVRRFHALNHRLLPQDCQHLGFLIQPEGLLAAGFHAGSQEPSGADRN